MTTQDLHKLRSVIDSIDEELIQTLARRFTITREIGKLKARAALAPVDAIRETRQQQRYVQLAAANHLDPQLVASVFRLVVAEVVREHREVSPGHAE